MFFRHSIQLWGSRPAVVSETHYVLTLLALDHFAARSDPLKAEHRVLFAILHHVVLIAHRSRLEWTQFSGALVPMVRLST